MRVTLSVPEKMRPALAAFIEAESLPFELVSDGDAPVKVVPGRKGEDSTPAELRAGGMIACGLARDMAGRLGVKTREIGKLLNHLKIKVRACDLGCFE